jgi:hypothetical protein
MSGSLGERLPFPSSRLISVISAPGIATGRVPDGPVDGAGRASCRRLAIRRRRWLK